MTSALKEPRKPPSVRLSTERGEAEASGERSLAAEAKAAEAEDAAQAEMVAQIAAMRATAPSVKPTHEVRTGRTSALPRATDSLAL